MSSTRIRTGIALATAAALSAGAITVLPSMAADTGTGTTTATTPAGAPMPPPGGPHGRRGPGGPPAIMLSQAAMHPDPPAGAGGPPMGPPPGGKPGAGGRHRGAPGCGPGGPMGAGGKTPAARLAARTKHFEAIGKELGKDGAAVTAAVRGAIETRLDKAVSDGKITADQKTQILKDWDQGGPDKATKQALKKQRQALKKQRRANRAKGRAAGAPPTPPTEAERKAEVAAFRADVAQALGVSVDDLIAAITKATPAPPAPPAPPAGTTTG